MKNGFTLIEVLGVIVVLAIISLITIPIIDSTLNRGKTNLNKVQEQQLIKALKDYYADYEHSRELEKELEKCKTVSELNEAGKLPNDIKNLANGKKYDSSIKVCVKKTCIDESDGNCIIDSYENNWKYSYYISKDVTSNPT